MTKAELIERTIDRITDPWTESCEDYEDAELIGIDMAEEILKQCRIEDLSYDDDDDCKLPADVTPELMMEAYNCNVRRNKHDLAVNRLAEWLTENECVCLHNNYRCDYENNDPEVVPCDFLQDEHFYFDGVIKDTLWYFDLFTNSRDSFDPDHDTYCWYDPELNQLFSSDTPFADGIIDAETMARFFIDDADDNDFRYLLGEMDDDDIVRVFGRTESELIADRNMKGE